MKIKENSFPDKNYTPTMFSSISSFEKRCAFIKNPGNYEENYYETMMYSVNIII